MTKLITTPTVVAIAATEINLDQLSDWASREGLSEVAETDGTPLNRIFKDIDEGEVSHLDLLSEFSGRHCYRSWPRGRGHAAYFDNILDAGHGSVLEHASISFAISGVSRALTHELIRHRAGFAVSQESQRYVNAEDVNFVVPPLLLNMVNGNIASGEVSDWFESQVDSLNAYMRDFELYDSYLEAEGIEGRTRKKRAAEAARASLPNSAETRLVWTGNMRALRHLCELRGAVDADLEIRRLASVITELMINEAPTTFRDFILGEGDFGVKTTGSEVRKV